MAAAPPALPFEVANGTAAVGIVNHGLGGCGQIPIPTISEDETYIASASLLIQLLMLITTFLIGHALRKNNIIIIHETGAALGFGRSAGPVRLHRWETMDVLLRFWLIRSICRPAGPFSSSCIRIAVRILSVLCSDCTLVPILQTQLLMCRQWVSFNNNFFFYFLLPPIILYP